MSEQQYRVLLRLRWAYQKAGIKGSMRRANEDLSVAIENVLREFEIPND